MPDTKVDYGSEVVIDWIDSLTDPQLRALASQSGITGWADRGRGELIKLCSSNANTVDIYEEHIGS